MDDERPAPAGWEQCRWPDEVIDLLKTGQVEEMSLDHDLGVFTDWDTGRNTFPTGYEVLVWLEEHSEVVVPKITIHTANPVARKRMEQVKEKLEER